jgi:DNA-binding LacI/PurR family transcriptional regulator
MVGREIDHSKIGCILCNHTLGGELSTRHVYEQGLKDVWFLDIQYKSFFVDIAIQQAIYNTAIEFNRPTPLKIPVEWKPSCEIIESAYSAVKRELVNRPHPEAILTTSDAVALGAVRAISESGGEVGKNVAVVGYDGGVLGICCNTPLTSVKQPTSQMGEMAADLLIEMAESNGDHPAQRIELSPELIVRSSSVLQKRESQ